MTAPYPASPRIAPATSNARMTMSEHAERSALVLIVLVVGALAGRASFSHVVDWSMQNLPDGTPRSYGYTNATVSELLPVGVLLFMRFQRRHGRQPGALAWSMLVGAGLFSVTAQLAVAKPSPSGWLVAAVPTLAFMALTKLLLSMKPVQADQTQSPKAAPASSPAPVPRARSEGAKPPASGTAPSSPATGAAPVAKRVTAKSLTNAAKVAAAANELGGDATPMRVAAKAGVSPSTVRRHLPPQSASSSLGSPAETQPARGLSNLPPRAPANSR